MVGIKKQQHEACFCGCKRRKRNILNRNKTFRFDPIVCLSFALSISTYSRHTLLRCNLKFVTSELTSPIETETQIILIYI